jgi:hypothetical protein
MVDYDEGYFTNKFERSFNRRDRSFTPNEGFVFEPIINEDYISNNADYPLSFFFEDGLINPSFLPTMFTNALTMDLFFTNILDESYEMYKDTYVANNRYLNNIFFTSNQ